MLELQKLWQSYGDFKVLEDINLKIEPDTVLGLIGPNGSGKTTLLQTLAGLQPPVAGKFLWQGHDFFKLKLRQRALQVALLRQDGILDHDLCVDEYVLLGRLPYAGLWRSFPQSDLAKLQQILEELNLSALAKRPCYELSGGEKQRVMLARCLIQETPLILLDEPTNHLDLKAQIQILDMLLQFQKKLSKTLVIVFHDLLLAKHYCTHIAMLKNKSIFKFGKTSEVLTQPLVEQLFDLESSVYLNDILKRA